MKKSIAILLIAVMVLSFAACAKKNEIVGTWTGGTHTWTFNKNGTGTFSEFGQTFPMTYRINGTRITVIFDFETDEYDFTIKGKSLNLCFPDSDFDPMFELTRK